MKHHEIVQRLHLLALRAQTDELLSKGMKPIELAALHAATDVLCWREFALPYRRGDISVLSTTQRVVGSRRNKWYEFQIPPLKESS